MKCFSNWDAYSLRKQFLIFSSIVAISSLLIIISAAAIYVAVIENKTSSETTSIMIDQATNNMLTIMKENVNLFSVRLNASAANFVVPLAFSTQECFRSDYPFSTVDSYYDFPSTLNNPIYDSRYNSLVSFSHSSYNVFGKSPSDIYSFGIALNITIDHSATLDSLLISAYMNSPMFLSGYFADESYGFIREYPGTSDLNVTTLLIYDPRDETWYQNAKAKQHTTIFVPPYYDNYVKTMMITVSRSVHHPETGLFLGVMGGDISLSTLQNDIKLINYYDSHNILFEAESGIIVADSNSTITYVKYYSQLTSPLIDSNLWLNFLNNANYLEMTNDYIIQSVTFDLGDKQYILVSFVSRINIYKTSINQLAELITIINQIKIGLGCLSAGGFILCIVVMYCVIHSIMNPLERLINKFNKVTQNLGEKNIFVGVEMSASSSGISEVNKLEQNFNNIISANAIKPSDDYTINPYYKQVTPSGSTGLPLPPPPPYSASVS